MSAHNKVIWSDGLFLQPQHFQQQDRYLERYVETRCEALVSHSWGFTDVQVERDFLKIGRIGIRRLAGVFPDGTPFRMPDDDPLPAPLEIGNDVRDQRLHLAVPLRRGGELESSRAPVNDELVRHGAREFEVPNVAAGGGESATLEVGGLRTRLLLDRDVTDAYACVPVAHVIECRADQQVVLDDAFIPTVLQIRAASRLTALTTEFLGLFRQRGETLSGNASATNRGPDLELQDSLMLQTINRCEPLLAHFAAGGTLHPETFFMFCIAVAGELATFTTPSKRAPRFPLYRHDRLKETFEPVLVSLRESLSLQRMHKVVSIPIERSQFGVSVAIVHERSLFTSAVFVMAVRSDGPAEHVRQRFPSLVRVAPSEIIGDLIRQGLPGIPVEAIPAAPRLIPFYAGHAYFEFDQSHELWEQLKGSGGVAIYVPDHFPGLTMELWAIRKE